MTPDQRNSDHERARMMTALSGPEQVSGAEQSWLNAHLESCAPCRQFAEGTRETIRSLRAVPIMAAGSLVSATQMRVRQRARELLRRQERLWMISICCTAVTICAALTTVVLWFGFSWLGRQTLGQQARFTALVWQAGFVALSFIPALVTGMLLLTRGTYLADHKDSFQG